MLIRNDEARCNATVFAVEETHVMAIDRKIMLSVMNKQVKNAIFHTQGKYEQSHMHKVTPAESASLHKQLHHHHVRKHMNSRRITAKDFHDRASEVRAANFLRRFCNGKFVT